MCRRRTRIVKLPPRALLLPQDMHEEGGGEGKKDAEESLMVCTDCVIWGYRGRLAPIVMLPKEFAGTVIKVTKSGVIKSIKAVESSARGLTSNNGAGEAEPRGAIQCLHNPLPRGHPTLLLRSTLLVGGVANGLGASDDECTEFHLRTIHPSRTPPAQKNRGVNDG